VRRAKGAMTRPKLSAASRAAVEQSSSAMPSATPRSFACSRFVFSSRRARARAYAAVSGSVSRRVVFDVFVPFEVFT
jgi:hypothetical protein